MVQYNFIALCQFDNQEVKDFYYFWLFRQNLKNSIGKISKIMQQETVEMLFKLCVLAFVSYQHPDKVFLHDLIRLEPKNSQNYQLLLFICYVLVILKQLYHFRNQPDHFRMVPWVKSAQYL
jgi:hypothetical protein